MTALVGSAGPRIRIALPGPGLRRGLRAATMVASVVTLFLSTVGTLFVVTTAAALHRVGVPDWLTVFVATLVAGRVLYDGIRLGYRVWSYEWHGDLPAEPVQG